MAASKLKRSMTSIALPGLVDPHDLADDRQFSMNLARSKSRRKPSLSCSYIQ